MPLLFRSLFDGFFISSLKTELHLSPSIFHTPWRTNTSPQNHCLPLLTPLHTEGRDDRPKFPTNYHRQFLNNLGIPIVDKSMKGRCFYDFPRFSDHLFLSAILLHILYTFVMPEAVSYENDFDEPDLNYIN